jgi:type III restriction enzyme
MITLKDYQQRVLDSLRDFLRICARDRNPSAAFQRVLEKNGGQIFPYIPVAASGLEPDMPYVCLRVPTGG